MVSARALSLLAIAMVPLPVRAGTCQLRRILELPVAMQGLRPVVAMSANAAPLHLLADTGAFFSMLTPAAVQRLDLRAGVQGLPDGFRLRGVTGSTGSRLTVVNDLGVPGGTLHRMQFLVAGGTIGGGADGLLGRNILTLGDIELDLANGAIRLFQADGCSSNVLAYWHGDAPVVELPLIGDGGAHGPLMVPVDINGHRFRAMIDSGAERTVLTLGAARQLGLGPGTPGTIESGSSGGIGRVVRQGWTVPIDRFVLGGEQVTHTRLAMADLDLDGADLLLGDDVLLSNRMYIAISQRRVYMTWNGGRMFDLHTRALPVTLAAATPAGAAALPAAADAADPAPLPQASAADLAARQGQALLARGDLPAALAALDRAVAATPDAGYRYQRGLARERAGQAFLAMADFDAAIAGDGGNAAYRLSRARLRLKGQDRGGARQDLDAAAAGLPAGADERLTLALLYLELDAVAPAHDSIAGWLPTHRDDAAAGQALAARCWAAGLGATDAATAVAECRSALSHGAPDAGALQGRGWAELRAGQWQAARADFDAALVGRPRLAWALYGRGVAASNLGSGGDVDRATAVRLAPHLPERLRALGLPV